MHKQLAWCIWMLAAALVFASIDATPDPPALDPHFATMKVPGASGLAIQNMPGNDSCLAPFQTPAPVFAGDPDPDCVAWLLIQVAQAADPSPPLFPEFS